MDAPEAGRGKLRRADYKRMALCVRRLRIFNGNNELMKFEGKSPFVYNDLRGATHAWEALRGRLGKLVNRSPRRAFLATGRGGISLRQPFIYNKPISGECNDQAAVDHYRRFFRGRERFRNGAGQEGRREEAERRRVQEGSEDEGLRAGEEIIASAAM
jgi:hypothetical protein